MAKTTVRKTGELVTGWHYIDLKNCQQSQFGGKINENLSK